MNKRDSDIVNALFQGKAKFTGTVEGTHLTVALPGKVRRRFRKAMTSRRWEKKFCKWLTRQMGYPTFPIIHIGRIK